MRSPAVAHALNLGQLASKGNLKIVMPYKTTFGNVKPDVLAEKDPNFPREAQSSSLDAYTA
jgi:hypothetical protein